MPCQLTDASHTEQGHPRFHWIRVVITRLAEHGTSQVGRFSNSVCGAVARGSRSRGDLEDRTKSCRTRVEWEQSTMEAVLSAPHSQIPLADVTENMLTRVE